jgi:hypothetical protein
MPQSGALDFATTFLRLRADASAEPLTARFGSVCRADSRGIFTTSFW